VAAEPVAAWWLGRTASDNRVTLGMMELNGYMGEVVAVRRGDAVFDFFWEAAGVNELLFFPGTGSIIPAGFVVDAGEMVFTISWMPRPGANIHLTFTKTNP